MAHAASGELFKATLTDRRPPRDARIDTLIWWAARFAELGFTPSYGPGDHGNLSCRTPSGLLVTARQTVKASLQSEHVVEVLNGADVLAGRPAQCRGVRLPSTDTLMHLRLYALRPEVHAILHGHDATALEKAQALQTPVTAVSARIGSLALIDDVCRLAGMTDYLQMRDHGFLALGRSIDEAGELVRKVNRLARSS